MSFIVKATFYTQKNNYKNILLYFFFINKLSHYRRTRFLTQKNFYNITFLNSPFHYKLTKTHYSTSLIKLVVFINGFVYSYRPIQVNIALKHYILKQNPKLLI